MLLVGHDQFSLLGALSLSDKFLLFFYQKNARCALFEKVRCPMENKVLLFGPDSVWVNVVYGDRPLRPGEEYKIQPEPRPLDELKYEELSA